MGVALDGATVGDKQAGYINGLAAGDIGSINIDTFTKSHNDDGMLPPIEFRFSFNTFNEDVRHPKALGIVPVKQFF